MDGTNEVMVMVEEELRQKLQLDNIEKVNKYIAKTEKRYNGEDYYHVRPKKQVSLQEIEEKEANQAVLWLYLIFIIPLVLAALIAIISN